MAKVNPCLKRTFTIFNILFAIIGGVIIGLALLSQIITSASGGEELEGRTTGLIVLYVVGTVTMVIAILGAYGAHKENRGCLVVFLVCMVVGGLLMLRIGVPFAAVRPQLEDIFQDKFRQFLPLDQATPEVKEVANQLQAKMHCCGLFSYSDWEKNIPESCLCNQEEQMEGMCQNVQADYTSFMRSKSVYSKPCFPILMYVILMIIDVAIGIVFTLASLALLGMILSSIIIHQMRYTNNNATILMTVPAIFTAAPPKYQELHNPPAY